MKIFHLFKTVFGKIPHHHYRDSFDIDCIVGFSFGQEKNGKSKVPGKSNEILAKIAYLYSRAGEIPLILQWEIAESSALLNCPKARVIKEQPPAQYMDTYKVAVEAMEYIHEMGYQKILVLAQREHAFRCKKVLESLGDEGQEFVVPSLLKSVPYSLRSKHIQTKIGFIWYPYEMLSRVFYLMKGYIKSK